MIYFTNKLTCAIFLMATCCICAQQCYADPIAPKPGELITVDGFQLSVTAESSKFTVNTPIKIDTFIKNVTDKTLAFAWSSNSADYQIEVTTDKGEILPLTRFGKRRDSNMKSFFSRGGVEVNPGKIYDSPFVISQIYDMTQPGEYVVKVSHSIHFAKGKEAKAATSNVLHITVHW